MIKLLFILTLNIFNSSMASTAPMPKSLFGGRISKMNSIAKLVRVRSDYTNLKYFNNQDRVEFWNENYPAQKCMGWVQGKSNEYLLIKIPELENCLRRVHFSTGSYLHFSSEDLDKNLKMGEELVQILQKKELALRAKKNRLQRDLDIYVEKVDALNKRYETLRQKLELEWKQEISFMEEDKAKTFKEFKETESRHFELESKLETYKVHDQSLKEDRWSLDPKLYYKK